MPTVKLLLGQALHDSGRNPPSRECLTANFQEDLQCSFETGKSGNSDAPSSQTHQEDQPLNATFICQDSGQESVEEIAQSVEGALSLVVVAPFACKQITALVLMMFAVEDVLGKQARLLVDASIIHSLSQSSATKQCKTNGSRHSKYSLAKIRLDVLKRKIRAINPRLLTTASKAIRCAAVERDKTKIATMITLQERQMRDVPQMGLANTKAIKSQADIDMNTINGAIAVGNVKSPTECRPWGNFKVLDDNPGYKVKRLKVDPGASLSLQSHEHRHEHWLVVDGLAHIEINGEVKSLSRYQTISVPARSKHRISNQGTQPLVIIETQFGDYLHEDDQVRYEDLYGRMKT